MDVYSLLWIDDALICLQVFADFSVDLWSRYWQIFLKDLYREKTAFVTSDGLFQFILMPFGLCSGPAIFKRVMDSHLRGYKQSMCASDNRMLFYRELFF